MTVRELYNWAIEHDAVDLYIVYNDSECGGYFDASFAEILTEGDNKVLKLDCN